MITTVRRNAHKLLFSMMTLALGLAQVGCVPTYTDYEVFMKQPRPIVGAKPYIIEPPDSVSIQAPAAPEINGFNASVRPDGYITVPLLGDVFAAGKTPRQLGAEIEEQILRYYQEVDVQVSVTGFNSKFIYLGGELRGGRQPYTGNDTVLDIVAGSVPRTGWPSKLVILRPSEEEELIRRMTINFNDMIQKGELKYNAVLEEGDIVYLPINPLSFLGSVVAQFLQPIQPAIQAVSTPQRVTGQVQAVGNDL